MALRLFNTLTKNLEEFKPSDSKRVTLYSCGPTVYTFAHIGNFRTFVFIDLLKRYLKFLGFEVHHIMNITDVDDKIIQKCSEESRTREDLTEEFTQAFFDDLESLKIEPASIYPKATDHIGEMQTLISKLIDQNYAYQSRDGSVFFKLSEFSDYGKLSGIDREGLSQTERVSNDEYDKESVNDFALWKAWKKEDGEVAWDSPWGRGRPAWHIECSAMSMHFLGETFDIHTGGVDLIFPHHENELAQSVCATGKNFAKYWLHNEHLVIEDAKMSKSAGNFYSLQDLLKKGYSSSTIRYLLLSTHYKQKVNLTFDGLKAAASAVERLRELKRKLKKSTSIVGKTKDYGPIEDFTHAMNDNLNISAGLAVIFNWARELNRQFDNESMSEQDASNALAFLGIIDSVLGVIEVNDVELSEEDFKLIQEREIARQEQNWSRADEIRDYFSEKGILLEDTPDGTITVSI